MILTFNKYKFSFSSYRKIILLLLLVIGLSTILSAQVRPQRRPPIPRDTIPANNALPDSLIAPVDSLISVADSITVDFSDVDISENGVDAPLDYESTDSMVYDIKDQKIHLYGNAVVKYNTLTLTADYIIFDYANNEVLAQGLPDSIGEMSGIPKFEDKDQNFEAKKMRYNFKTSKGVIYDVTTTQSNLYVLGTKAKFTSKDSLKGRLDDIVYSQDALFTTCSHEVPHYGIRSKKQKLIPNKLIVVGPSNLEIAGVPTPLWLPFGFFPTTPKSRSKGLLFPKDYEYSNEWGFGLRNVGWYTPINDYMDLTLTGDIYFNGTWGLQAATRFRKRYKYNGNFSIGYSDRRQEAVSTIPIEGTNETQTVLGVNKTRSWAIRGSLSQAAQAHPTINIGGSVNIQTNNYASLNRNDARSVLQQTYSSNFSFRKTFPDRPFSLSAAFSHSQNVQTGKMRISLPTVDFQTQTIYPFRGKGVPKNKWYEQLSFRYKFNAKNEINAVDSTLFTRQTLEDLQFGASHDLNVSASFRILKYFNFTPSANYEEKWYFKTTTLNFIDEPVIDSIPLTNPDGSIFDYRLDTTAIGRLDTLNQYKFQPIREYSFSAGLGTQLFGTMFFKKGFIRGIRHVMKPTVSFGYSPNYESFDYYDEVLNPNPTLSPIEYAIVQNAVYGRLPDGQERLGFNISVNNNFEAKYYSKKDSTEKKLRLFDNIVFNTAYNAIADSLKWSPIRASGNTRFFDGVTTLGISAEWDFYEKDFSTSRLGRRVDTFIWKTRKRPVRFEEANFRLSTNLTVGRIKKWLDQRKGKKVEEEDEDLDLEDTGLIGENDGLLDRRDEFDSIYDEDDPFNRGKVERQFANQEEVPNEAELLSLFENFSIRHNFVMKIEDLGTKDSLSVSTHTISMNGNIPLTTKWAVRVGNIGYDFKSKRLTYPDIGISRNLHCWNMSFNWQPTRGTYSFTILVSDSPLNFLKLPYARNNVDSFRF